MPRERSDRVSIVSSAAVRSSASTGSARSGDRASSVRASRRFTASATRCCWAPSWMSRSSRRRSSSCGGDDALARCPQLHRPLPSCPAAGRASSARRPDGPQHQPCLRGESREQLLLHRREGLPVALLDDEDAQLLVPVAHREHPPTAGGRCRRRPDPAGAASGVRAGRPGRGRHEPAGHGAARPGRTAHRSPRRAAWPSGREPRRWRMPPATSSRNRVENLVRRRTLAAGQPRSDRPRAARAPARTRARRSPWRAPTGARCGASVLPMRAPPPRTTAT